jgi:hypothetical protein
LVASIDRRVLADNFFSLRALVGLDGFNDPKVLSDAELERAIGKP